MFVNENTITASSVNGYLGKDYVWDSEEGEKGCDHRLDQAED
jgi:hypothetical protein